MKKEKTVKNIIIYSILGFPIGITILIMSYAAVYLIAGENTFKTEIMQLQNINTLVLQLVIIGFVYYLFFLMIGLIGYLKESKTIYDKYLVEHPLKTLLLALLIIATIIIMFLLLRIEVFSTNIVGMNIIAFAIVFVVYSIWFCISSFIESNIIKIINKKLKEKN